MVVVTTHDRPTFDVRASALWWLLVGRRRYTQARRLLIEADAGGSNDYRKWEWKVVMPKQCVFATGPLAPACKGEVYTS